MNETMNTEDPFGKERNEKSLNGKKIQSTLSATLKLDSLLRDKKNLEENFESIESKNVVDLSMQDNNLSHLTLNFAKNLSNLVKLNLSNNNLTEIESSFKELKYVQQLIVDKNQLKELPSFIGELNSLRLISVRGNKLVNVNKNLGDLIDLEKIDLSHNKINNVDDSLARLDNLKILNLSHNELKTVPNCLSKGLKKLETLCLSNNVISEFNTPFFSKNLKVLYLNNNPKNNQFPVWLIGNRYPNFEELVLDETVFVTFDIPKELPVSHIRKLSMTRCGVSDIIFEQILKSMTNLEYVNVGNNMPSLNGNFFWLIPIRSFKNPEKLNELNIERVGLPAVPEEINTLLNLTRLNISRNNISCLPNEVCELKELELINAAHNNLYALPESIGNLTKLKILMLANNKLSSLPDSIERLMLLEYLDLYDNEFLQVPQQLKNIPNLRALDIDGNGFKPEESEIIKTEYVAARNKLRSMSNLVLLRSNDLKIFDETDDESAKSISDYEADFLNKEDKSTPEVSLSDINSVENWNFSDDSADEFDPTEQPRTRLVHTPFTVSSLFYYGNFCPADLHNTRVRDQLAAMQQQGNASLSIAEGQFDDA